MRHVRTVVPVGLLLMASAGCDYTGDWLFAGSVEGLDAIQDLGELPVAVIETAEDVAANVYRGEVGPTGTPEVGGVTFTFKGTGGTVCVWVDPEAAYWVQSLSPIYGNADFAYPDNPFDDGDLDVEAGLAVFYNGSPGEAMGTFQVRYEDSLGNVVPISANECTISYSDGPSGGHMGRGFPEYCDLSNTQPGVNYLVALETFATPIDDDRLAYGLLLAEGSCQDIFTLTGQPNEECVIGSETLDPNSAPPGEIGEPYTDNADFELSYCASVAATGENSLAAWCNAESDDKDCNEEHCFCGNLETTAPTGG